ncbi:S-adenosyl-L-methionine-dependent methyltransferase [Mycena belliarum]|uniref:S-adenosyl-L-methionine-dependent methyltransferase n=1 Tax=Mycena belliarum TaxID=1033014 RepID=A0AAD6XLE3_9AGAR|nr:S-adenosyl-L-methionine-dependent methyltransferase [Mycena belliae]
MSADIKTNMKWDYSKSSSEDNARMEEFTSPPARAMLVQAGLIPSAPEGALVLDNACGTAIVASLLFEALGKTSDVRAVCGDLEEVMVKLAAERIAHNGWNAEARVADAQALPFPDNHFTHNMMNFGIQLMPDNPLVLKESFRVLKSGGKVGMTTWITPGWLPSMQAAIPSWTPPPLFTSGPMASTEAITGLLRAAGFVGIEVKPISFEHSESVARYFKHMKPLLEKLLGGEKPSETYEAYMRERHGDGDLTLTWEAFVITAEKP